MNRKSAPFSMRLDPATDALVAEEAKRTHRSKGAVLAALAAEALKMRLFPGVAFRGEDWDRRAYLLGTALDVWQVVEAFRDFGSVERMAEETDLREREIRLAVAYRERFSEEIDTDVERNRRTLDELAGEFPFIDVI